MMEGLQSFQNIVKMWARLHAYSRKTSMYGP